MNKTTMNNRFLQLHLLTSYPPANLNRDDLGRPKTAMMGGTNRLRVSSQSLKRAWRTSSVFEEALGDHKGTRSKEMGESIRDDLVQAGMPEKLARDSAKKIAGVFGKLKKANKDKPDDELHIEQLSHFSPAEIRSINGLIAILSKEAREPTEEELKLLGTGHGAADIALFGRMLASAPSHNVEAAAQVAHAIGVHKSAIEDDYFTAVDDLNKGIDDSGAAHLGETEFGAGLFYLYICIDRSQLVANLDNDHDLARQTISAIIECATTIAPKGKQNSFASRAYASYVLAEKGNRQPRSLSVAFLKPIQGYGQGMLQNSIVALEETVKKMDSVYGECAAARSRMNAHTGDGTLNELVNFAAAE